jgi:hypothetical protein
MNAESVGATGDGGGGVAEDYILIRDEKPSGTVGGTFTQAIWQTRDLTVEVTDTGGHASLSSNQITLASGTYKVKAYGVALGVNFHKLKLYNVTDAVDIVIGSSEFASPAASINNHSFLEGEFTIADTKVLELQHRCITGKVSTGFGQPASFGVIEVYAAVEFWRKA